MSICIQIHGWSIVNIGIKVKRLRISELSIGDCRWAGGPIGSDETPHGARIKAGSKIIEIGFRIPLLASEMVRTWISRAVAGQPVSKWKTDASLEEVSSGQDPSPLCSQPIRLNEIAAAVGSIAIRGQMSPFGEDFAAGPCSEGIKFRNRMTNEVIEIYRSAGWSDFLDSLATSIIGVSGCLSSVHLDNPVFCLVRIGVPLSVVQQVSSCIKAKSIRLIADSCGVITIAVGRRGGSRSEG